MNKKQFWINQVAAQRQWIDAHGGCEAGYVERYGSASNKKHYGDGGEAIWKADKDELDKCLSSARQHGALI